MARFSNNFTQSLANPSYLGGLFTAAENVGSAPGRAREKQEQERKQKGLLDASMALEQTALKGNLNDSMINDAANSLLNLGMPHSEIMNTVNNARALNTSARQRQIASLDKAGQDIKRTAQLARAIQMAREAGDVLGERQVTSGSMEPAAYMNSLADRLRKTEEKTIDFGTGITEWVDSSGNTVLKTVQSSKSPIPFELGSGRLVEENELAGLTKKPATPGVSFSLGDKGDTKYAEEISRALAEQDAKDIESGEEAADNLATINEARLVLEENPDVLGLGSENIDTLKKGFIRVLSGMGVTENDPVYKKITEQSSSVDLYRSFTQDFVQKRMDATKGAISDREYSSFIASVPNLMQTEEGYRSLLNLMERANTAAVLRSEHLRSAAMSEGSSKQSVYKARQEWNNFRRNFPLGMIPSKSMTEVWGDYNKPDFNKDNMVFSVLGPDGTRQLTTYKDIVEGGRNSRDNLTAHSSIKRAFEKFDAVYVPLM